MAKIKVNVWQVGYATTKDYVLKNADKLECRNKGYVIVDFKEGWEEVVWDLLNWSCWSDCKPDNVHSPLDHCNSDVIFEIEGSKDYKCAMTIGFENALSMESAFAKLKKRAYDMWKFADTAHVSGYYTCKDGKAYWRKNREDVWQEVTW